MRDFAIQDQIETQFFDALEERNTAIAIHALDAWDGETIEVINPNLEKARRLLKEAAVDAFSAGYLELAAAAQNCDTQITAHLDGPYADLAICPGEIIWWVDTFIEECRYAQHASF